MARRTSVIACVAALAGACAVGAPVALVTTAGSSAHRHGAPGPARAGSTERALPVSAERGNISARAPALPSKRGQEQILDAAYQRASHEPKIGDITPGPMDLVNYGIGKLWSQGIDGAGTTIAVMEAWDDPSIAKQVAAFDKRYGLPNPRITTIFPSGDHKLPAKCPPRMNKTTYYGSCAGWASELYLDVLSAHLMAPYAKIVISVTPGSSEITEDAASQEAPPEFMQAVEAISRGHLANVVSISGGTGESTYSHGQNEVTAQNPGELTAAATGIPVVASTGDCGPVQTLPTSDGQCQYVTKKADTATWDDSPWTLAVGGSVPNLETLPNQPKTGTGTGPDPLWNPPGSGSGGAGFSSIFRRPAYQSGVASITHSPMRSVPDITMDASQGTSEAAPLMAGVLALATQANGGRDIGPIHTALYDVLGPKGAADGIADVVRGDNSVTTIKGKVLVRGFTAHKGFDVASGWGTIYAPRFVPALARATRASHDERTVRARAAAALAALRRAVHLAPARVQGAATSHLTATGFLPLHPVVLSIAGRRVGILHADRHGDIHDALEPARLHLATGTHTVALKSMLITVTGRLTTR